MSFVFGAGYTNCDLLYSGLPALPAEGTELYAKHFVIQIGGGPPATLINLKKLGVPTKLATFLGDSLFCGLVKSEYARHNMDYVNLYHGNGTPITITTAMITPDDRTFVSYREDTSLSEAVVDQMAEASLGAGFAIMDPQFLELHKRQKAAGTTLIFDMGWEENLSLKSYADYLTLADYYTPNQKEALQMTGTTRVDDAIDVLSNYFSQALIKLDKDGCLIKENGVKTVIPPMQNIVAVDSTGAGDAFLAGFLYGLYHEYDFADCVRFGNITGGICVEAIGCLGKQINETELLELRRKYYG